MKPSPLTQNGPVVPSLFQIAAHFEGLAPAAGLKKSAPTPAQPPFVNLVLRPEKLEATMKNAGAKKETQDASLTAGRNDDKRRAGNPRTPSAAIARNAGRLPRKTRKVDFLLEAPSAKSVKLAADFTDWEKCPLDMMPSGNGVWSSTIPLEPGQYAYRFIVDGQWCDDPRSTRRIPNPFGTENALRVVI